MTDVQEKKDPMTDKKEPLKKRILVNASQPEECRVAIVHDEELVDIHTEKASMEQARGNIYKGVIMRVDPGLQAAFVEYDKDRKHGFLQFKEIRSDYYRTREGGESPERPKIQDVLSRKQEVLVQVEKDARDLKGASLTTYISLAGRYLVLMPGETRTGISRKIEGSEDRSRVREIIRELPPPENTGYIVRTSGLAQTKETLAADLNHLVTLWGEIQRKADKAKAPALIHQEGDVVIRAIRDYLTDDVVEILIDNREVCRRVKEYVKQHIPKLQRKVKEHRDKKPLFAKFGVEDQLELVHERKVSLASGGSIVIDSTEALTAIDVNSGKTHGEKDIEDLALRTNLEAVEAVAKHLRLRDVGGLIVVDFIDMKPIRNRRAVEQAVKEALHRDKAKTDISQISKFGLLEISRQRMRPSFRDTNYRTCPVCGGAGHYRSPEFLALMVLRELDELAGEAGVLRLRAQLPAEAATYLLNVKRNDLADLEKRTGRIIVVEGADVPLGHYRIFMDRENGETDERNSMTVTRADEFQPRKKKKKSRRKRGKEEGSGTEASEEGAVETEGPEPVPADEKPETETAASHEEPESSREQEGVKSPSEKRTSRRRRRRPGRHRSKPAVASSQETGQASHPAPSLESGSVAANAPLEEKPVEPVTDAAGAQKKSSRKRRRPRRKTPSGAAPEGGAPTVEPGKGQSADASGAEAPEGAGTDSREAPEAKKPGRRRPRRGTAKAKPTDKKEEVPS